MDKITNRWRFAIDRGGTFTDVIGVDPEGHYHTLKLLSESPDYNDPAVEGIRRILKLAPSQALSSELVECIRLGTTVATNALLQRKGGRVLLLTTKGFADMLDIGYQSRDDLFSLCIKKPLRLYSDVVEVDERIDAEGRIIKEPKRDELKGLLRSFSPADFHAVAVVFMHSWINPEHELLCEELLKDSGFENIFLSHRTSNQIKIITRGQSTIVDAYLSPVLAEYLEGLKKEIGDVKVEFFVSSGGLVPPEGFKGKDAVLSGPAGGAVAIACLSEEMALKGAIGFDMGGTSTDVSRYDGQMERVFEKRISDIEIQTEMLDIHTVASGGGSILWFDGQKMRVGPDSAGAYPGPACYGFGGPLTITDANLLTGRLIPEFMPKTFGQGRDSTVDISVVQDGFERLRKTINEHSATALSSQEVALGFLRVANERMAQAIKEVSISKGVDVRDYALVCFGGAGGQHACRVASLLDMKEVIFHPLASLFSAYGIGLASTVSKSVKTHMLSYDAKGHEKLKEIFHELEKELLTEDPHGYHVEREIDLRVKGTDRTITVRYSTYDETYRTFVNHHRRLFGFFRKDAEVETVTLRISVRKNTGFLPPYKEESSGSNPPVPVMFHKMFTEDGHVETPVYRRETLSTGTRLSGPALIVDNFTTLVIDKEFEATVHEKGVIVARRLQRLSVPVRVSTEKADPVLLEVFNNLFTGIATEMGHTLRNTAHSVNIKERLDFSCAIFDPGGELVANAPHIPVHLGSMADTVKAILRQHGADLRPGDIYVTNNPYRGGSHLPDITVISPVFSDSGELLFFTAARGHHADIGGTTPGSMPPEATHISEEGILIDGFLLLRGGRLREEEFRRLLTEHPYPVRDIEQRIADLIAQMAACRKGETELKAVIDKYGYETVRSYMAFIQDNGAFAVKLALWNLLGERDSLCSSFEDCLDDGTVIKVKVSIQAGENPPDTVRAVFDFTGTDSQHCSDNLNAPLSVTRSAVLYVLRTLTDDEIPLNSGCLRPVRLIVPERSILNPDYPVAVASGNVETSQRVVDVLLCALGVAAASQGTMNNLLFEVEGESPYYETLGGGYGATEGCDGASAIQVHMTNTRITDPEVLELRHPGIMLKRFIIRRNSGGRGRYRGGNGLIREILFKKPATVTIISERRSKAPFGLHGGAAGRAGVNLLRRRDGSLVRLPGRTVLKLSPGESVIIKTPGGGGYGTTPP